MVQNGRFESKEFAVSVADADHALDDGLPQSESLLPESETLTRGVASLSAAPSSAIRTNESASSFTVPTTQVPPALFAGAIDHGALLVEAERWLAIIPPTAACYRLLQLGILRRDVALLEGLLSVLRHT